ncbi:hypothetical protein P3W24_15440 [Luteibacter sp. PPL201]|uniref:P-type conjugative transfer protein TrbJ n=1 Tax=Luteibacter sahnii TaxID=3021977 RepID=A0ABT6BE55_9GAMM|nr:hypothetical protein [Luteibacter sp. PPL193]MDY1548808.1 hypothetical protein [Luteibacter sp. PPL193]
MKRFKTLVCSMTVGALALSTHDASAFGLVWDIPSWFQLKKIAKQLQEKDEGTVNYYTNNIDNSTRAISSQTFSIDQSTSAINTTTSQINNTTTEINKSTTNIDKSTSISADIAIKNIEVNKNFTVIINKNNPGEEIIPIPSPVKDFFERVTGGRSDDDYAAQYKAASDYAKDGDLAGFEGSRARKAANDVWLASIKEHRSGLQGEAEAVATLSTLNKTTQGHGQQMQIANAMAQSQVNQLMQLRSMLLVSEAARLTQAQAGADKESRALATSARLRSGLREASSSLKKDRPEFADTF